MYNISYRHPLIDWNRLVPSWLVQCWSSHTQTAYHTQHTNGDRRMDKAMKSSQSDDERVELVKRSCQVGGLVSVNMLCSVHCDTQPCGVTSLDRSSVWCAGPHHLSCRKSPYLKLLLPAFKPNHGIQGAPHSTDAKWMSTLKSSVRCPSFLFTTTGGIMSRHGTVTSEFTFGGSDLWRDVCVRPMRWGPRTHELKEQPLFRNLMLLLRIHTNMRAVH